MYWLSFQICKFCYVRYRSGMLVSLFPANIRKFPNNSKVLSSYDKCESSASYLGQVIQKKLLNTVLEGLSEFAHLINIDFFSDLIIVLQKLVASGDLDFRQKLCCIFTTFKVNAGEIFQHEFDSRMLLLFSGIVWSRRSFEH